HAATVAYTSAPSGLFFSMRPDELTVSNIGANHWASFTIDDYTPDFRKVRELRGVGRCDVLEETYRAGVQNLFAEKFPAMPAEYVANLLWLTPLELHFVDFEYTAGVAIPHESSIVYQAAPEAALLGNPAISTQLSQLTFAPGQVIVSQG